MQRAVTIALGIAAAALAVVLVLKSRPSTDVATVADASPVVVDAAPLVVPDASPTADDFAPPTEAPEPSDGGVFHLADGTVVPPLGPKAPKQVRFGVVLVAYQGAEGVSPKGKEKADALAVATKLAEVAKTDFSVAVRAGDDGSAPDIGIVDRNILEPTSEAVLFGLPVGGTSGVIDTPRGFWIVKRLE